MDSFDENNLVTMNETEFNLFIDLLLHISCNFTSWSDLQKEGLDIDFEQLIELLNSKANSFYQNEKIGEGNTIIMVINSLKKNFEM